MAKFGLIGKNIGYSFSKGFFTKKFEEEALNHTYENYDIDAIASFNDIVGSIQGLRGLNVTIPFKEAVIPYLDKLHKKAQKIGAVNTIKITKKGKLIGYNTDYFGFKNSLQPLLREHHKKALVLGTGGASKAIVHALKKLDISYAFVSRVSSPMAKFTYDTLTDDIIDNYHIIINCTPVGTYPNINDRPDIPYKAISPKHILYDLIYNPKETAFLKQGRMQGAIVYNGEKMLELQANKAWEIWQ